MSAESAAYPSKQGTPAQLWAIYKRLPKPDEGKDGPAKAHVGSPTRPDSMRGGGGRGMGGGGGGAGRGMLGAGLPWGKTPEPVAEGKAKDGLRQLP